MTLIVSLSPHWESLVFHVEQFPLWVSMSENVCFGCFSASWGVATSIHQVRGKRLHPCRQITLLWTVSGFLEPVENHSRGHGYQDGTPDIRLLPCTPAGGVPGSFCLYAAESRWSWLRLTGTQGKFYWAKEGPWCIRTKSVPQKQEAASQHHESLEGPAASSSCFSLRAKTKFYSGNGLEKWVLHPGSFLGRCRLAVFILVRL